MKGDELMKYVNIAVRNKIARTDEEQAQIVCGNSDYTIKFDFDEEWSAETVKTARFIFASNSKYIDVQFSGDECHMPIISDTTSVLVGVFAGNLRTTTGALIHSIPCITDPDGTPVEPTPDVYAQLMERFNAMNPPAAVLYTAQELTDEQKAQARENIGAADKNATEGGGDAPSGGGGGASPYKTLYSQMLEEAGAVSVTMDDEAAACNEYLMYLAVLKGDAAVNFNYETTVFGARYAMNNLGAINATYVNLIVVSGVRAQTSSMFFEVKAAQASTGVGIDGVPRAAFLVQRCQYRTTDNASVLFSSAIELPAGTQILILGR